MSNRASVEFRPGKMGGEPTVGGLRITTVGLHRLMDEGMTDEQIIGLYPVLTVADLEVVRWFYRTFRLVHRRQSEDA